MPQDFARTPLSVLGAVLLPASLVIVAAAMQPWVPLDDLMRDPIAIAASNDKFYYGLVSNLGVLLWCAAAAVCLFGTALLHQGSAGGHATLFLLYSGFFSALMLVDDLFLLHEFVVPNLFGIGERRLFLLYGLLLGGLIVAFQRLIRATDPGLFCLSLALFALGLAADQLPLDPGAVTRLLEDGCKFLGIAAWAGF